MLAESNRTLFALQEEALLHANSNQRFKWLDVDEYVQLQMVEEGLFSPRPNLSDKHEARYTLRFNDLYLWVAPDETIPLVQEFNVSTNSPKLEIRARAVTGQPC